MIHSGALACGKTILGVSETSRLVICRGCNRNIDTCYCYCYCSCYLLLQFAMKFIKRLGDCCEAAGKMLGVWETAGNGGRLRGDCWEARRLGG